jgi:anti-anti-sigma factor
MTQVMVAPGHGESNDPGRRGAIAFGRLSHTTSGGRVPGPDETEFHVTYRATGGEFVVSVFGEVDIVTTPKLLEAMGVALDSGETIILDLAAMSFIDSQGVKVLVEAHAQAQQGRLQRVVIRSPRPQARKVLEVTGLAELLTIED